ncbi:MAG: helix-turn-helix domain-containing protein [Clostridiales bacterium]|jgi:carbohydrate diacid regulator|nr:helix-turn-helix domain-containing protein [Clostridiales bacterium]
MTDRLFNNIFRNIKINKTVGIVNNSGEVLFSNNVELVGKKIIETFCYGEEIYNGYTYLKMKENKNREFYIFGEGTDDHTGNYCEILNSYLTDIKRFYDEKNDKDSFIKNMLTDNILPGDSLHKSKELQILPDAKRIVLLFRSKESSEMSTIEALRTMLPEKDQDFVVSLDSKNIVLIKEIKNNSNNFENDEKIEKILNKLCEICKTDVIVGVSRIVNSISKLSVAYMECRISLEISKILDSEKKIIYYNKLGIARLIYQLPTTLCELYLKEVFKKGSIALLDEETFFTIQEFFENSLNVSETARKLFIHRNTLVYRLDKIKKLTGLDLRKFDDAIVFKVAVMVNKYLNSKPSRI